MTEEEYHKEFERNVRKSKNNSASERRKRLENAKKKPKTVKVITTGYKRNPDVVAEVLERAKGYCEECGNKAPFLRASDNTPYLEVHHHIPLSKGGDDIVKNAFALCPNCHRKAHFG